MGAIELDTTHTLRGVSGDRAEVAVRGQVVPATGRDAGAKTPSVNATYSGSYKWDTRAGELESYTTQLSMTIEPHTADAAKTTSQTDVRVERVR